MAMNCISELDGSSGSGLDRRGSYDFGFENPEEEVLQG